VSIDPLKLISSGTLLLAVRPGGEERVESAIASSGSKATSIGRFAKGKILLTSGGKAQELTGPPKDEIWRLHERAR
jgi:hydrogenase maturation factor